MLVANSAANRLLAKLHNLHVNPIHAKHALDIMMTLDNCIELGVDMFEFNRQDELGGISPNLNTREFNQALEALGFERLPTCT